MRKIIFFLSLFLSTQMLIAQVKRTTASKSLQKNNPKSIAVELPRVTIGKQTWTTQNLSVDHYRNGDIIPQVTDAIKWASLTTGAWCWYNNDSATYAAIYGRIYNWYAVNDPRGLAPQGYHVPSDAEWTKLVKYLDSGADTICFECDQSKKAGGAMKSTMGWTAPNTGATNSSGFAGLPGGFRASDGTFDSIGNEGNWWSSTEGSAAIAYVRELLYLNSNVYRNYYDKLMGFSVRCIRDYDRQQKSTTSHVVDLPSVKIGSQIWTTQNLSVDRYRNGDIIPQVTDPAQWEALTTGAWCWYDNDSAKYGATYGRLYNWYAVNDPRGLAPIGWHIPSDGEWNKLVKYLDPDANITCTNCSQNNIAGEAMKSTELWRAPNAGATNSSGFVGLPGGFRNVDGSFNNIGDGGLWWSSTENYATNAWGRILDYSVINVNRFNGDERSGFSVRCIRDYDKQQKSTTSNVLDLPSVKIGSQVWTTKNLSVTRYRNGDVIPQVTDPAEWVNLTTGAWCYYENNAANGEKYGKLYNWFAVNDARGLAPQGYHIPSDEEWTILTMFLGGERFAGSKMKSTGTTLWIAQNPTTSYEDGSVYIPATNSSGFAGLPGGSRGYGDVGSFVGIGIWAPFWSSTEFSIASANFRHLNYDSNDFYIGNNIKKINGYSVRCLRD